MRGRISRRDESGAKPHGLKLESHTGWRSSTHAMLSEGSCWRKPMTRLHFIKLKKANPPVVIRDI